LGVRTLQDLVRPEIRFISIAQPELAPYGQAAIDALKAAGLWETLQTRVVYANNISVARQYAATGNADAAFTASSLVLQDAGTIIQVDSSLYSPIDQAMGIVAASQRQSLARQFAAFVASVEGKAILRNSGYGIP
jgi:molybdate transport system substrate-binding protein